MREVMVGRARLAVLRTAAKSAVLWEKSRAEFTHCKIFQERGTIGLAEQAGAWAAKRFHPTSVAGLQSRGRVAEV